MRCHANYIKPNLIRLIKKYEVEHPSELVPETIKRYARPSECCECMSLITIDDIARFLGVGIGALIFRPGGRYPSDLKACCFVNNFRLFLTTNEMSKRALEDVSGISQTAQGNYLAYKSVPSMANLQKMADALGVTIADFFKLNVDLWKEEEIIE